MSPADRPFRLEASGRVLGRFRGVRRRTEGLDVVDWQAEPGASASFHAGTIALTEGGGRVLRRWACLRMDWSGGRPLLGRLRRAD